MRSAAPAFALGLLVALDTFAASGLAAQAPSPEVEPSELASRPELVGREVVVDDRVRYFSESKRGQGYDEIHLRRTEVPVRLPARLRFTRPPTEPVARVRGVLAQEGGRLAFEVRELEMKPADPDRLEAEVRLLRPGDFAGLRRWGLWAQRRGKELNEPKIVERGQELEGEALWAEAARPEADALALSERAADRPVPPGIRNALAHKGFRALMAEAMAVADRDALIARVTKLMPDATTPRPGQTITPDALEPYAKDPARAYRDAYPELQRAFNRRLLADLIQQDLEQKVRDDPGQVNALADAAKEQLSDRPEVAEKLRQAGLDRAEAAVTGMRQAEVEALARTFRDDGNEDRARKLWQAWLADRRRNRISAGDAEGRVLLAAQYDRWLSDRDTAAELLREAAAIDPGSQAVTDAFLRLGYRKVEGRWVDPRSTAAATTAEAEPGRAATPAADAGPGESLKGLTRQQVRARLGGKPDRVVRSATQGQSVEQWIYSNGKTTQVINFVFTSQSVEPRASAYYSTRR